MLEYYSQHPLYAVLVCALAVIALIVLVKAVRASAKRSAKVNKMMEKMKEENLLLNKYAILTQDVIESSDSSELFKGVGVNLQKRVSDKPDMKAEFFSLNDSQKYVYSLYTFLEDAQDSMSNFFKLNTKPLTEYAAKAVEIIAPEDFRSAFIAEYNSTDEDNEEVSFVPELMEEWDKKAAPAIADGTLPELCGKFIKENYRDFI